MTIFTNNDPKFTITYHRNNGEYELVLYGSAVNATNYMTHNKAAKMPILPNMSKSYTHNDIQYVYRIAYNTIKNKLCSDMKDFQAVMERGMRCLVNDNNFTFDKEYSTEEVTEIMKGLVTDSTVKPKPTMNLERTMTKMLDFFSEFSFVPSFRFLDTISRKTKDEAIEFIINYFKLSGNGSSEDVKEKMNSMEFETIMNNFYINVTPADNIVNNRLKVYFGSAGTGKTTKALEESEGNCIICNNDTAPSDLMEDFTFDDGKATFHPSALAKAMEEGKKIVLDEINLLPFSSLRFLQGITDGKTEFMYKGNTIHIADGFEIIGTMNLTLGGMTYGLPEPLVDRCADIEEYSMNGAKLASFFKQ